MNTPPKKKRRVLAGIVSAVALLLTSTAVVQFKAASSWRTMQDTHKALRAGWLARSDLRTPLWGTPTEGSAFAQYEQAAEVMAGVLEADAKLRDLPGKTEQQLIEMASELRESWQPALVALRTGAHMDDARIVKDGPYGAPTVNMLDYRWIANAAAFESRFLRREGRDVESVRTTLDSLTMAADICNEGLLINQMIGVALVAIAVEPWHDAALQALSTDAKAEFADGLARLDALLPAQIDTDRELLFVLEAIQDATNHDDWVDGGSWRYGFSNKWMLADALLMTSINYHRMRNVRSPDWNVRERVSADICKEIDESGNELASHMFPNLISCDKSMRHSLGKVRLLRMALDAHRGEQVQPLADPFTGEPLRIVEQDGELTLMSPHNAGHEQLEFVVSR